MQQPRPHPVLPLVAGVVVAVEAVAVVEMVA
jgi:hypothetical protein